MSQRYAPLIAGLGSAGDFVAITPDDENDLAVPARALWIGGTGDVEVIGVDGSTPVLFENVPDGTLLPVHVRRVLAGNTDASGIIGLL